MGGGMVPGSRQIFSFGCTYLAGTMFIEQLILCFLFASRAKHLLMQCCGSKAFSTAAWQRLRSPGTRVALAAPFLLICSAKVESLEMHQWSTVKVIMKTYLYRVQGDEKSEARGMVRLASFGRQGSDTWHRMKTLSSEFPKT